MGQTVAFPSLSTLAMVRDAIDFDLKRLQEARLDISKICCQGRLWHSKRNHRAGALIAFKGEYQFGSAGDDDARFIRWKLEEFHDLYRPDGLVIDCRELNYTWGDDLSFSNGRPGKADECPMLMVLRSDQQAAFEYAVEKEHHRLDMSAALSEMDRFIRSMKPI